MKYFIAFEYYARYGKSSFITESNEPPTIKEVEKRAYNHLFTSSDVIYQIDITAINPLSCPNCAEK